jgi:hypothetical protein
MALDRTEWEVRPVAMAGDVPLLELRPIGAHFALSASADRLWALADQIAQAVSQFNAIEWERLAPFEESDT